MKTKKNTTTISETQLRNIIAESVKKVLSEEKERFSRYGTKGDKSSHASYISMDTDKDWGKKTAPLLYQAAELVSQAMMKLPYTKKQYYGNETPETAGYADTLGTRGFAKSDKRISLAWNYLLKSEKLLKAAAQDLAGGYDADKKSGRFNKPDYSNNDDIRDDGVFQDDMWAKMDRDGI